MHIIKNEALLEVVPLADRLSRQQSNGEKSNVNSAKSRRYFFRVSLMSAIMTPINPKITVTIKPLNWSAKLKAS